MSFLVSSVISAIVLASALDSYFSSSHHAFDHKIISETRETAKSVLDLMTFDLRMTGSGMPLNQGNFQIGDIALGADPEPILTTASATFVSLRRNTSGVSTVLVATYTPLISNLTMSVISGDTFEVGDVIYVSDAAEGGSNGLRGTITAKSSTSISIASSYTSSASASFPIGSLVEKVATVSYASPIDDSGITRDVGLGATVLRPNTTFTLRYFDDDGAELSLPLTQAMIRDELSAIEVTVQSASRKSLKAGAPYIAQVRQRVALRNLYLSR